MTMTIDEIDAEIAKWELRYYNLIWYDDKTSLRSAQTCLDNIEKLRRQRLVLTEQTERK